MTDFTQVCSETIRQTSERKDGKIMRYITVKEFAYLTAKEDKRRRKEANDARARANDPTIQNFDPFEALMKMAADAERREARKRN